MSGNAAIVVGIGETIFMRVFGKDFVALDEHHLEQLLSLEREGAVYTDHWIDALNDFRHVRISFTTDEVQEYVRRMWALEFFLRAGSPDSAQMVPGIDPDIAAEADRYSMETANGKVFPAPYLCPAAFLGEHLESLVCSGTRAIVIEEHGRAALLSTIRRSIDALTPAIRLFSKREKRLNPWAVACEDDVRDLLYAMLRPAIADLGREEPIPSKGGGHKFVDLCSNTSRVMVEIKWLYKSGDWKKIVKQIYDDIQSYPMHPASESLIFVVIDSAKDVADPAKMERELSGVQAIGGRKISVQVYIREP